MKETLNQEIQKGVDFATANESYDLEYSEMRAISNNNHDVLDSILDAYYLGIQRGRAAGRPQVD